MVREGSRVCGYPTIVLSTLCLLAISSASAAAELTLGLIPEQNVFRQVERYQPIGEYIRQRTGVKIRFTILPRYGNIFDSFTAENMDGAFWGSFTGALAIRKLGVEPVARPLWRDGTSSYRGYLFVRKDSGIRDADDMKGKTIVFVDKATTAGYVFPRAYLREHGVGDLGAHFKERFFAGSHDAAIAAVLDRKADIGCAKNTIYHLVAARDPRVEDELLILATSSAVPSNGLGIRKDLDPAIKKKLRETLLGMAEDPAGRRVLEEFGATAFISTTSEDYAPVFEIAKAAGIDLQAYDYVNE